MRNSTGRKVVIGLASMALLVAACGDDDEDEGTTDTTAATEDTAATDDTGDAGGDFVIAPEDEEYCTIAIQLDEQEDFPTTEQLESIRAAAPEEISDAIDTVVDAFQAAGDDPFAAFENPEVEAAFDVIEPFEAEHCGLHSDEDDEDDQDEALTQPDPAAAQVAVTATDYAFALDPAPSAGRTQFTMSNEGQERHVMYLFKLSEGRTVDDVLESEGEDGYDFDAESDSLAPGEEGAVLTVDLTPGDWAMICYIPNADGTPHFMLGMQQEFTIQ
jgi:uncharacterized cupredoxin-like copper-binding protein